ncbi:MAG: hypothetical protein R2815_11515 [Flavobacteriales bacterium]
MRTDEVSILSRDGVNHEGVTAQAIELLKILGAASGNGRIEVSRMASSPYDQARVMYNNCNRTGTAKQYKVYGQHSDMVIAEYEKSVKVGKDKAGVIDAMYAKIKELGPSNVTKHCVDTSFVNVLDIPFASISDKNEFRKTLKSYRPYPVSDYHDEPQNNCFHIEKKLADVEGFFLTKEYGGS